MWVLLFIAAWALSVVVDRIYYVFIRSAVNSRIFLHKIESFIRGDDVDGAVKYCESLSTKPLAAVAKAALLQCNQTIDRLNSVVDEAMLDVLPRLQKRTVYLFTFANLATLVGLLGTITGLIQSFGALEVQDPSAQASRLGAGISVAMLTTAFGLMIAVPTILAHTLIQNKTEQIIEDIDSCSAKIINLLESKKAN